MRAGYIFFLLSFLCFAAFGLVSASSFYVSTSAELTFSDDSGIRNRSLVSDILESNIRRFVSDTSNARCAGSCMTVSNNVTIISLTSTEDFVFDITIYVYTKDAASAFVIAAPGSFFPNEVRRSWNEGVVVDLADPLLFVNNQLMSVVEGSSSRPVFCGDGNAGEGEECDDFNTIDGDGCSWQCKLESGWMCANTWRSPNSRNELGFGLDSITVNGTTTYSVSTTKESCPVSELCQQGELWEPDVWLQQYGVNFSVTSLPPRGFYCTDTCASFPVPSGMIMNTLASSDVDLCSLKDLDECLFGLATCSFMAYCENLPASTTGAGYACYCDQEHFPTGEAGVACSDQGFELVFLVAGNDPHDVTSDIAKMELLRETLIDTLLSAGVFKTKMTKAILLESVHDYPPELVRILSEDGYANRGLYEIKVRAASVLVNVMDFVSLTLFSDLTALDGVFTDSSSPPAHKLYRELRCSNEQGRVCTASSDCLNGGTCGSVPAVNMKSLDAGGTSAPFYTDTSGASLISVTYDNSQTGWHLRWRYTPRDDAVGILFMSKMSNPATAEQLAGFFPDEFPCLPFNVGEMQQRRDSTVCCLSNVNRDYTAMESFGEYMSNNDSVLSQEISRQNACYRRGTPPPNSTRSLLNGTLDFVTGRFQRMSRSTSSLDTTVTKNYQDLLVFIAYEDVLLYGGISTKISGGNSLRFLVGMAFLGLTDTQFLSTSVSSQEVFSDITNSYVFSTTATTQFTFVKDVDVSLIEVLNQTSLQTLKFARILIGVPSTFTSDEVHGLIPIDSIIAKIGYTKDTAPEVQQYYPCINMYTGVPKQEIDTLLSEQSWCSFQDELCKPLGPTPVNVGGQISFYVPLQGDAWQKSAPAAFVTKKLFLDFVLSVKKDGKTVMTNVETKTEITAESINTMCKESRLSSAIDDMFSIDLHLGLANSTNTINASLESAYDVTRMSEPVHLSRDVSTTAGNILTMILRGRDDVFSREYSRDYSIEIDDYITVYFLSLEKKQQVDSLVAAGRAVEQQVVPGSISELNLRPTEELLSLCPLQAMKGAMGCITRYEVKSRQFDRRTNSIVAIAPDDEDDYAATMNDAAIWTQLTLGDTTFANNMGSRHADAMNQEFNLNSRYRKGFLISPVVPWRKSELRAEGFENEIGLSQYSMSFVMIAFDQNVGISFEPVAQVAIPGKLPITADDFTQNLDLQNALASAYAQGLGLPPDAAEIDPNSIREELVNDTDTGSARRRLLGRYYITLYEVLIKFYEKEESETGESVAQQKAAEIVDAITDIESSVADVVFEKVKAAVETACSDCPLPEKEDIQPPVELREAIKNTVRDVASCMNEDVSVDLTEIGGGTATCEKRTIDGVEYEIGARGPLTQAEWDSVGGGYRVTEGMDGLKSGRASYDLCGSIPAHFLLANVDDIQSKWDALKAKFSTCCLCKQEPKEPRTKRDFVLRYSWSVPTQELTENIGWKRKYESATGVSLMNPQIDTFRSAPALSLKISKENLPPASWKFSRKTGLSYIPAHLCTDEITSNWFGVDTSNSCGNLCRIGVQKWWDTGGGSHLKPITCNQVCANAGLQCNAAGNKNHLNCDILHSRHCDFRNDQVGMYYLNLII